MKLFKKTLLALSTAALIACGGGGFPDSQTVTSNSGGNAGGGTGTTVTCNSAAFVPTITYAALTGTTGTAIAPLLPTTNLTSGCPATTYTLAQGSILPAGLSLNSATGAITGTPTAATTGSFTVKLMVTGVNTAATSSNISVTVTAATATCNSATFTPTLSYGNIVGTVGTAITSSVPTTNLAAGCPVSTYSLVSSVTLPSGLSLNTTTGVISGTPTAVSSGTYAVKLAVAGVTATATSTNANISIMAANTPVLAKWTMMVYVAGDNNLSQDALNDLAELKAATVNSNVNVVVQMEYSSNYVSGNTLAANVTHRGKITGANTVLSNIGMRDMGDKASLTEFVNWAKTNHAAEKYALVLWSHGGGWKQSKNYRGKSKGALEDESAGSFMSLADIRAGIASAMGSTKLDVLAFDSCLMGQYEVAYELRGTSKYLVASEELVPGAGMPYTPISNILTGNPAITSLGFATGMSTAFKNAYNAGSQGTESITMSVVDLSTIDALHAKLLDFSTVAHAAVTASSGPLSAGRTAGLTYGGTGSQSDSIDLWRYADYVASNVSSNAALVNAANALKTQITTSVVQNDTLGSSMANSKGIAIYFPAAASQLQSEYNTAAVSNVATAGKSTWYQYLSKLYNTTGGNPLVDGKMSYYINWNAPAGVEVDVDLGVNEAANGLVFPYFGTVSLNGFLSNDSIDSLVNFESYTAKPKIDPGQYDVFINLYGCTDLNTGADITGSACSVSVNYCAKIGVATTFTCTTHSLNKAGQTLFVEDFYNNYSTYLPGVTSNQYSDWKRLSTVSRNSGAIVSPLNLRTVKFKRKIKK